MRKDLSILVVGSIHLDFIVFIDPDTINSLDKMGTLKIAVGGTAFNVLDNLNRHNIPTTIYSVLKKDSFATEIIKYELDKRKVDKKYIQEKSMENESGFFGAMLGSELINAISCVAIQDQILDQNELRKAIKKSKLVAIECNLSTEQIGAIASIANEYDVPLCASVVSQSKVRRIWEVFSGEHKRIFKFVILNKSEMDEINSTRGLSSSDICRLFSAENVIITMGQEGIKILSVNGGDITLSETHSSIVTTLGAGDSVFAAFCYHFDKYKELNSKTLIEDVGKFLAPVLAVDTATPHQ